MEKIKIEITETLSRIIEVEEYSDAHALEKVLAQYNDEQIILNPEDFINVEIKIYSYYKDD